MPPKYSGNGCEHAADNQELDRKESQAKRVAEGGRHGEAENDGEQAENG